MIFIVIVLCRQSKLKYFDRNYLQENKRMREAADIFKDNAIPFFISYFLLPLRHSLYYLDFHFQFAQQLFILFYFFFYYFQGNISAENVTDKKQQPHQSHFKKHKKSRCPSLKNCK